MILIQKSQEHLKTDHSDVDHGISGIVVPVSFTPDSRYTSPDTWRAHDEHMNALMSWKGPKTSTSPCELLNMAFLSSYFFLHAWNCVWRLLCRHCACSCKINSCIFKKDANESAPWTGLLAWNLITSVLPFANEFTFPFCLFSFSLLDRCYEFQIWHDGLSRNKMPISCFIQQSDFCFKRKVRQRQKEKNTKEFGLSFASYICTFSNWWFSMSVVRLTLAQRWEDVLSTASLPRPWWPSFSVMLITTFKPELM